MMRFIKRVFRDDDLVDAVRDVIDLISNEFRTMRSRLSGVDQELSRIRRELRRIKPREHPRAICDRCKVDVILPTTNSDEASDYVQNIGWTLAGEQTLCPGCSRIQEGR